MKVVLITGASSGIGRACSVHLHHLGYRVYGTSRYAAKAQDGGVSADSDGVPLLRMDLTDQASIASAIDQVWQLEGRLDVVVNNAGSGLAGAVEDTAITEARAQLDTNFFGMVRVCQAVIPLMREQGSGLIVNISSMAGVVGIPFQSFYSASKFAVEGFSQALRGEIRSSGIRVVVIRPGDFNTGFTANRKKLQPTAGSPHSQAYTTALGIMERDEASGPVPELIARQLARLLASKSPPLYTTAGSISQRFLIALRLLMPMSIFERLIKAYYRL
ncbi:SDR family oxidoreductase [Saccharospirillum sp.]|uniref:SDR family oxidoreductase n=1 Tax=Saccharospirillum sp. TaxID=2033801 RepID=UPI0034A02B48